MTNIVTTDNKQIDGTEIEKVTYLKYLGQRKATRQEVLIRIKAGWSVLGKYREIFQDMHLLMVCY